MPRPWLSSHWVSRKQPRGPSGVQAHQRRVGPEDEHRSQGSGACVSRAGRQTRPGPCVLRPRLERVPTGSVTPTLCPTEQLQTSRAPFLSQGCCSALSRESLPSRSPFRAGREGRSAALVLRSSVVRGPDPVCLPGWGGRFSSRLDRERKSNTHAQAAIILL